MRDVEDVAQLEARKRGDRRKDGFVFWGYRTEVLKSGFSKRREVWVSPASYSKTMANDRQWRLANKARLKSYTKEYERCRRANDPLFRLVKTTRTRIAMVLSGHKSVKSAHLVGCSAEKLKRHLEEQFVSGMNWENYGSYWHADHIIPLAWFDLSDPNQQRWAFHYTNLQPLTKEDNLRKNSKIQWRGTTAT
jgi:hypothetical protein